MRVWGQLGMQIEQTQTAPKFAMAQKTKRWSSKFSLSLIWYVGVSCDPGSFKKSVEYANCTQTIAATIFALRSLKYI